LAYPLQYQEKQAHRYGTGYCQQYVATACIPPATYMFAIIGVQDVTAVGISSLVDMVAIKGIAGAAVPDIKMLELGGGLDDGVMG
jgi:hypothetical protein